MGEGIVGVICSETILGEGERVLGGGGVLCAGAEAAGWPCAEVPSEGSAGPRDEPAALPTKGLWTWGAGALWPAPGGMGGLWLGPRPGLNVTAGGDWGGRLSIPDGPEKEPFLVWKGTLDLRKPGSERRLEEALSGPGGGTGLPRKEKLPPELMEAARRLYS